METTVRIDASEVVALAGAFRGAPALVADEMGVAMAASVVDVEGGAKGIVAAEAHDLGALGNSLAGNVRPIVGGVEGIVGTGLDYAASIHEGRAPGSPMPPQGALLPWMRRHGIDERLEFVVRRKIGRDGTKGIFFLRRALTDAEPRIRLRFGQVPARVVARMGLR